MMSDATALAKPRYAIHVLARKGTDETVAEVLLKDRDEQLTPPPE